MLESLNIRNFALIEDINIEYKLGFNVLSGETGAGKSIVIGALAVILGDKTSASQVRSGADFAGIEGLFNIRGNIFVQNYLKEYDLSGDSDDLIIRRTISKEGKSRTFINGSLSNLNVLKDLGSMLVDIHGQHEHQSLLKVSKHIGFLDDFASFENDGFAIAVLIDQMKVINEKISALDMDEKEKERKLQLNDFAIKEIDDAKLENNEDSVLEEEARVLNNFEKIHFVLEVVYDQVGSDNALAAVRKAAQKLESASEDDSNIAKFNSSCQDILFSLEDLTDQVRDYRDGIEFSPERVEEVNGRLAFIQTLKRKYGNSIKEILTARDLFKRENESISQSDSEKNELVQELVQVQDELSQKCFTLSEKRQQSALVLEERIMSELAFLGMERTIFKVDIRYVKDEDSYLKKNGQGLKIFNNGIDYIEFVIAPNPGEPPQPLRKIGSGGEISRIMLALKAVLTSKNQASTVVFDEVDAGIGGVTATAVGKKLKAVSEHNQVLCITHLPQIAALGDNHLLVRKSVINERTKTEIVQLSYDQRLEELARMLGGEIVSETTLEQARQMIAG